MPLDIVGFRADRGGDVEKIKESQRRRYASVELVDEIIAQDNEWRKITGDIDNLKKERNAIQKVVGQKKKNGEECESEVQRIKSIGDDIDRKEKEQEDLKGVIAKMLNKVGNIVDPTVPVSNDEANNAVVSTWGTCRDPTGLLNHHDLLWRIGGYEPERGVAVAGHRAYFLKDVGVLLNQAFINYGISFLRKRKYSILQPPFFMKENMMAGVAQLEQFDEELYKVSGGDGEDKYLIATSEQPICGYHAGEWLNEKELPLRYCGVSTCFRKEAGSHGKDTWGIFRVHQFEKIEQFVICDGDLATSQAMQEEMIKCAEEFYQSLGFPYQVINIVSGALNNAAIRKYDLEAWFPGYNAYRELVSCSNCTDYQSRAMEIRCGIKKLGDTEKKYVHMLNATLCATGRAICCLLENYQEPDGVRIPEVLVPFMGGITFLPFVRDSRNAPSIPAAPKANDAAKPKPAQVKEAPKEQPAAKVSGSTDPATAELESKIAAKGEEVRKLKADKADKAVVQQAVDELLSLKSQLASLTGAEPSQTNKPKEKPQEKQEKAKSAPAKSNAAQATKQDEAPKPVPSGIWNASGLDTVAFESKLKSSSYAAGFTPSGEDNKVLAALAGSNDQAAISAWLASVSGYEKNTSRWLRNVASFTAEERSAWK